ncbi:MAG TPA: hypothetical protein V6C58_07935 [Allocoleopsis sp.]
MSKRKISVSGNKIISVIVRQNSISNIFDQEKLAECKHSLTSTPEITNTLKERNLMIRHFATLSLAAVMALPLTGVINQVVPESAVAQAKKNRVILSVSPQQSRYPRGTMLRIQAEVLGSNNKPLAGTPILVQEIYYDSGRRKSVDRTLVSSVTNHSGQFVLNYTVPTDPNKDKITLTFVNPVGNGDSTAFVIPIGR